METQMYTKEGIASDGKYAGKQLLCYFLQTCKKNLQSTVGFITDVKLKAVTITSQKTAGENATKLVQGSYVSHKAP